MLKQLLKQEVVFGIFEMTASYKNLFLPRVCSFKLKKINFIVFGDIFKKDCSFDDFNFLAGDSDSV